MRACSGPDRTSSPDDGRRALRATQVLRRTTGGPFGVVVATLATVMLVAGGTVAVEPRARRPDGVACTAYLLVITRPGGSPLSIRLVSLAIVVQTAVALGVHAVGDRRPLVVRDLRSHPRRVPRQPLHARRRVVPARPAPAAGGPHWRHTPSVYGPAFSAPLRCRRAPVRPVAARDAGLLPGPRRSRARRRLRVRVEADPFGRGGRVPRAEPADRARTSSTVAATTSSSRSRSSPRSCS